MSSALLDSPADIVRQALVIGGECVDPAFDETGRYTGGVWPVFAQTIPKSPDQLVAVFNGTDRVDARTMRGDLQQHSGLQLRIRADNFNVGQAFARELQRWMAEDVYRMAVSGGPTLQGSYTLFNFAKIGPVLDLGMNQPSDKRFNFTINMLAAIRSV